MITGVGFLSLFSSFVQRKPLLVLDLSSECCCFFEAIYFNISKKCLLPTHLSHLSPAYHTGPHLRL